MVKGLAQRIPEHGISDAEEALEVFLDWVSDLGIELYEAQEEAILELYEGQHCLLKTPTGSGKSLVALALHFREFARAKRSIYTAPIKALVSEKFFNLCEQFGAEHVGLLTGDASVNIDAPIVCCTAEVLAQLALRHGDNTPFSAVIMDEFHYFGDADRGMAWQVPLLTMGKSRFLLMSATLGPTKHIEQLLEERTGVTCAVVSSVERPVPLSYRYSEKTLLDTIYDLATGGQAPCYVVHFTQREATERAQALLSTDFCSKDEKKKIKAAIGGFRFDSPFGKNLKRMVLHGIGLHHAGLLPKYRLLVERVAQKGLFKVICGTDTLGVGINVPIRSVLFTQLCKFNGEKVDILSVRHFRQIAGRAGRKGFDVHGLIVAQAPAWVIENQKISANPKKKKKKKLSPPTRGYKHWDEATFERLQTAPCELLTSQFRVDHSLIVALLGKVEEEGGDVKEELFSLIDKALVSDRKRAELKVAVVEQLDTLMAAGVVVEEGGQLLLQEDLQLDFSLHHALSLFVLHAIAQLDPEHAQYHLQVVSIAEAVVEHPKSILFAQVRREKTEVISQLKADGVPYEDRLEALEEVTYPKPMGEWLYATFSEYAKERPWLVGSPIRPKSIVREMVEQEAVFSTYVKGLQMERLEGVLLRYVSQVYKTLAQNVPAAARTESVADVLAYLRALLARVDDSLLTEWEDMRSTDKGESEKVDRGLLDDLPSLRRRVRAELYAMVRALAEENWEEAAACVREPEESGFDAAGIERALRPYLEEHDQIVFDGRIKQGWTTRFEQTSPGVFAVSQVLVDDDEDEAWSIDGVVELTSGTPHGPLVRVINIGTS